MSLERFSVRRNKSRSCVALFKSQQGFFFPWVGLIDRVELQVPILFPDYLEIELSGMRFKKAIVICRPSSVW
jgi:hypothetical protein